MLTTVADVLGQLLLPAATNQMDGIRHAAFLSADGRRAAAFRASNAHCPASTARPSAACKQKEERTRPLHAMKPQTAGCGDTAMLAHHTAISKRSYRGHLTPRAPVSCAAPGRHALALSSRAAVPWHRRAWRSSIWCAPACTLWWHTVPPSSPCRPGARGGRRAHR